MTLAHAATLALLASVPQAQGTSLTDLKRQLADPAATVRRSAAEGLGKLGADALPAAGALAAALADKDAAVAEASGRALGRIGVKAIPVIRDALVDGERQLRALVAVEQLGPRGAELMPAAIKILRKESVPEFDAVARCAVAVGAPAVPYLAAALKERVHSAYVARILASMGPVAKPALLDLMAVAENRSELNGARTAALQAVGQIKDGAPTYVPRLIALARSDKDDDVRIGALGALFDIGVRDPVQREAIEALTKDRSPDVAQRARIVLEKKLK